MTPDEAWRRLRAGTPAERRAILETLAAEADARVTPAVAALLQADDPELVALAEATLWRVWSRSGDPAVDALFAEGLRAMEAQDWLAAGYAVAAPVTELVERSGLPERTFKRRFARATGYSPIAYVQHVRVEEAKRRLERTSEPVDAISYAVGYEDPASFRRLFKRITGVTPGAYRRKLQLPAFARREAASRTLAQPPTRKVVP